MMKILRAILFLAAATATAAEARVRGAAADLPVGRASVNFGGEIAAANFNYIDVHKAMTTRYATLSDVGKLDDDGFPVGTTAGTITFTPGLGAGGFTAGTYILNIQRFPFTYRLTTAVTGCIVLSGAASISGCAGVGNTDIVTSVSGARVQITVPALAVAFPAATYGGSGPIALYLASNEAKWLAGQIWTDDLLSMGRGLRPHSVRTMGMMMTQNNNGNNHTRFAYQWTPTGFTWSGNRYPPTVWAGGPGTSGAITDGGGGHYTADPATDTSLAGWVDGEVIAGVLSNANVPVSLSVSNITNNAGVCQVTVASTANITNGQPLFITGTPSEQPLGCTQKIYTASNITATTVDLAGSTYSGTAYISGGNLAQQTLAINGKSGGAKVILDFAANPITSTSSCIAAANNNPPVFIYNSTFDALTCWQGLTGNPPIDAQISLANGVGAGLWANIPASMDDAGVVTWSGKVRDQLNPTRPFVPEVANEVWNFNFPATGHATRVAGPSGWGITTSSNQALHSWYGLRVAKVMGDIIPTVFAGQTSRLLRVLSVQGGSASLSGLSNNPTIPYRLNGTNLSPSLATSQKYCEALGGTWSGSCSGGTDYSATGNRPVDKVDAIGYAPYAGGANYGQGPDIGGSGGTPQGNNPTTYNVPFYQNVINAMDAGNTAAAVALVDDDIRRGRTNVNTVTAVGTTFTTPAPHNLVAAAERAVAFQVTGGTAYSGINTNSVYIVMTTPTTTTFTARVLGADGTYGSTDVNAGSAGTGTMTVGSIGPPTNNYRTIQYQINTWVAQWQATAALYDVYRAGAGRPIVKSIQYEGNLEPISTLPANCTSLGLTSGATITFTADTTNASTSLSNISLADSYKLLPMASIANGTVTGTGIQANTYLASVSANSFGATLSQAATATNAGVTITINGTGSLACSQLFQALIAWRNSASGYDTTQAYLQMQLDAGANSSIPSWLVVPGPIIATQGPYGLLSNQIPTSAPTQVYYGFGAWSQNWLLKRDIDPASNDNSPMWLGKAA